jgi:integrase
VLGPSPGPNTVYREPVANVQKPPKRERGTIRKHHGGYQVRVSAGTDPVTGERLRLQGSAPTEKQAERLRTKLLAEADAFRSARTNASLGYLLDRWLPQHEIDENTRESYDSLIRVHIRPALGEIPLTTLVRKATETVEQFYGELRRCRDRCDGRTLIDHRIANLHECGEAGCRPHVCRPLAASTVCRIHAVLSAACRTGQRWGWMPFNPMDAVRQPSKPKPSPRPPSPAQTARLVEEATRQDPEWGLYLWLAIVTGARRGEMCALRWNHLDLDAGVMTIERNYVWGREKDPKSHQMRRVSIDAATVELLRRHKAECEGTFALAGERLDRSTFVFSAAPDRSRPRDPSSMSHRFRRLADSLGIDAHLHTLRHYAATELLTAGVDLRTVAGRLGHGDGSITLRHYAAWVIQADQRAASILSMRLTNVVTSAGSH